MVRTYRKRRLRGTRRRYGGRRRLQSSTVGSYGGSYAGLGPPRPYSTGPTVRYSSGRTRSTMMARRARNAALNRVRRKNTKSAIPKGFQMTRQKYVLGKNYSNGALLRKLDNQTLDQRIYYTWGINRCTAPTGYYELGAQNYATNGGAFMPLILHELTANNIGNLSGVKAWTSMRMLNTTSGNVVWYPLNIGTGADASSKAGSITGDGVSLPQTADQAMIQQSAGTGLSVNQMLEWINAKFCFRLPTQRAGWIKISMISFTDNDYQPGATNNIFLAGTDQSMFWQRVVKPSLYSPIQGAGVSVDIRERKFRVLKSWTKTFQPAETTEGDGNGNHYQLKIFARLNKYLRYANQQPRPFDAGATTADELTTGEQLNIAVSTFGAPGTGSLQTQNNPVDPKTRVYLLVQGSYFDDITGTNGLAVDSTKTITYDYHLRSKFLSRA